MGKHATGSQSLTVSSEMTDTWTPDVFLYHHDGGYVKKSKSSNVVMPLRHRYGTKPSRFRIVPVPESDGDQILENITPVKTRSDFVNLLSCLALKGRRVAIEDAESQIMYISCRQKFHLTNSAMAEFRSSIGEYESFVIEHDHSKGTFSFKSHNDLYLHYNKQLGTIAFKACTPLEASWIVDPVGLRMSHNDLDEYIVFVGVLDFAGKIVFGRVATGVGPEWKTDLDKILQVINRDMPNDTCSIFQHPDTTHKWCVAKYKADKAVLVVTTNGYPPALATECHDQLTYIYEGSTRPEKLKRIEKHGLDIDRIHGKELASLMIDFDEQYYTSKSAQLTGIELDLVELQNKMGSNIDVLLSNIEDLETMNAKAEELLEMSKLFKKRASKLHTASKLRYTTLIVGAGLGAGTGALVGWLVGGPGGALILASEGLEIGVGAVTAGVLGGCIASSTASFWSRRFLRLNDI